MGIRVRMGIRMRMKVRVSDGDSSENGDSSGDRGLGGEGGPCPLFGANCGSTVGLAMDGPTSTVGPGQLWIYSWPGYGWPDI